MMRGISASAEPGAGPRDWPATVCAGVAAGGSPTTRAGLPFCPPMTSAGSSGSSSG
ncbi:MAG: hypothetical protein V9H69_19050 [Anaerolineae bacterium]